MKAAAVFVLSFLFFSAGIQGRLGSMLAAFIDPTALQDVSNGGTPATPSPADAITSANTLADTYASLNGGVRPTPVLPAGTLNQCPPGYVYNYQLQQCVFAGTTGRHA